MKITKKIPAFVLIAIIIAGAAAAALGYMALGLARYEQGMRNAEIKSAISARAKLLAGECRLLLEQHKQKLIDKLRASKPTPSGISDLRFSSPFIANVFITNKYGTLVLPRNDLDFNRRFYGLFFEIVSNTHRESRNALRTKKTPQSRKMYSLAKSKTRKIAIPTQLPDVEAPRLNGTGRMTTRFGRYAAGKSSGWIPWFSDNSFRPILWTRNPYDRNKLVGVEVETIALLARIQTLMPQDLQKNWRLELIDGTGRLVCAAGSPGKDETSKEIKLESVASYMVWREDFPGWRIRACLMPGWNSSAIFTVSAVTQILSLLLIIVSAGLVMSYLLQRELKLASQKTSFVANVSHELKTPLTSIRMYAEMLSSRRKQISAEKEKRYLSVILSESERLSRLITNVLDFSRTEAGRKKYHLKKFPVMELIDEINEIWLQEIESAGVQLKIEAPAENILLYMDRDALFQTLHNLLSNALKYAASGGEICLSCHAGYNNKILIEVRDRGPGIPAKLAKHIFKKFYRCDNSLTAETSGSGLGLSIARKLMNDQGGDLIYLPREGGGSIFRITLGGYK